MNTKECFRCGEKTVYEVFGGTSSWGIYETHVPTCLLHLYEASLLSYRRGIRICNEMGDDDFPHSVGVLRDLTDKEIRDYEEATIRRSGEVRIHCEQIYEPELSAKAKIALRKVRGGPLVIF